MPYDANYGRPDRLRAPVQPTPKKQSDPDPQFEPLPPPVPWTVVGGGGGGGIFGQVQDGSGATYTVQTFSGGPTAQPDDPSIQVTILQIDPSETIPIGTWIGPIATTTDKDGNTIGWTQVPIWLDSSPPSGG